MSKPKFEGGPGIYFYSWEDHGVSIRLDRIYEDTRHNITCEVTVKHLSGEHIHQARLNLSSSAAREKLGKMLKARLDLDWYELLEVACVNTLDKYRAGEPVIRLDELPEGEKLRWRLEPILVDGYPNLIYGPGGIGKSLLAVYLGVLVSSPHSHNGLIPEPGNVLYLDWEFSDEETRDRADALLVGMMGVRGSYIYYRFCFRPFGDDIEEIRKVVVENNIKLVVLDSAGPACGGQPESAEATLKMFTALRSLRGVTALILAHEAKNATEKSPFGSVYWTNLSRSVYQMRKVQDLESNVMNVSLLHKKANTGKLQKPLGFRFTFMDDGSITVAKADVRESPELVKGLPTKYQLVSVLRYGSMSVQAMMDETGLPKSTIAPALTRGEEFVQLGNGDWGLAVNA